MKEFSCAIEKDRFERNPLALINFLTDQHSQEDVPVKGLQAGNVASDSRYSMTQYFQKYLPEEADRLSSSATEKLPTASPDKKVYLGSPSSSPSHVKRLWEKTDDKLVGHQPNPPITHSLLSSMRYQPPEFTSTGSQSTTAMTGSSSNLSPVNRLSAGAPLTSSSKLLLAGAPVPADSAGPVHEQLHSTLKSNDSDSTLDADLTSDTSTLSMATTLADNKFQEGLAQLDANIAKLQQSLRNSQLSSTM